MKKKLTNKFLFIIFLVLSNIQVHAQSEIYGVINDAGGKPVKDASVLLLKSSDSSLVMG